jgi:hypothetical protein
MELHDAWSLTQIFYSLALVQYAAETYVFAKRRKQRLWPAAVLLLSGIVPWLFTVHFLDYLLSIGTLLWLNGGRRRGLSNGGSDYMLIVLSFAFFAKTLAANLGVTTDAPLIFIGAISVLSYARAGWTKLREPSWRDGSALNWALQSTCYQTAIRLPPQTCQWLALATITFELSSLIAWTTPLGALLFCVAGFAFHLGNFIFLGLNRFFWVWLATYPALLFLARKWATVF